MIQGSTHCKCECSTKVSTGGVEYAKVDLLGHRPQWTACTIEGAKEEGSRGCLFRLGLPFNGMLPFIVLGWRVLQSKKMWRKESATVSSFRRTCRLDHRRNAAFQGWWKNQRRACNKFWIIAGLSCNTTKFRCVQNRGNDCDTYSCVNSKENCLLVCRAAWKLQMNCWSRWIRVLIRAKISIYTLVATSSRTPRFQMTSQLIHMLAHQFRTWQIVR